MRIGVNLRQFAANRIGGMENYLRNVLPRLQNHQLRLWVHEEQMATVRDWLPEAELSPLRNEGAEETIAAQLRKNPPDVYFCPLLVLEPLVPPCPSAVLIPDLQHEYFPEFFTPELLSWRRATYGASARNADRVLTLSEHARKTIVEKLSVPRWKVDVVGLDIDEEFRRPLEENAGAAFQKLQLGLEYVYFPANYWPHKNHARGLEAFARVARRRTELQLVMSGAPGPGEEEVRRLAEKLGIADRVRLLGHIPRELQAVVYRCAKALFFPSLFEGFGIPLLEAFHSRIPVLAPAGGSCAEIAAGAALLVDTSDTKAIEAGLERLLDDAGLREALVAKGDRRCLDYSWERAAQQTEAALRVAATREPARIEEWPRVGIVTPSYQMARFLRETVESVLGQNYPHIDYFVADGGSTDGTRELLQGYAGKLRWHSKPDGGQGQAINQGFRETTGPVFAYLNADDTYLPGGVGKAAEAFRRFPNAGLIYGEGWHVDELGRRLERYASEEFDWWALSRRCFICQPAAFVSREAFDTVGGIDESLHFALDYDLWIRIGREFHVRKHEDYLANSRMHGDNKTLSARRAVYGEIFRVARRHYGYVPPEWVQGYACHLLDRKDQFFERSRPTTVSRLLSLAKGMTLNSGRRRQYWREWKREWGIGEPFTGKWEDGWISNRYQSRCTVGPADARVRVAGRHEAPIRRLRLRLEVDGQEVAARSLESAGPFTMEAPLPSGMRGRQCEVVITADRTWRPIRGGDYRRLSCRIDEIRFDGAREGG
jgi:glycosyltransferase involved in cell wall biosynthesis